MPVLMNGIVRDYAAIAAWKQFDTTWKQLARISHNTGEMDDRVPLLACPAAHGKLRENTAGQASSGTLR